MTTFIRHKRVKGICYLIEVNEESRGRCPEHNPKKKSKRGASV